MGRLRDGDDQKDLNDWDDPEKFEINQFLRIIPIIQILLIIRIVAP